MLYNNIGRLYQLFTYDIYKYRYFTTVITDIHMNIISNYFLYVEKDVFNCDFIYMYFCQRCVTINQGIITTIPTVHTNILIT